MANQYDRDRNKTPDAHAVFSRFGFWEQSGSLISMEISRVNQPIFQGDIDGN
jgi:hypothetical protein